MTTSTLVFLDAGTLGNDVKLDPLARLGNLIVHRATSEDQVADRVRDARVVLTNKVPLDATSLRTGHSLELVVVTASVADNVDLDEASRQGIEVHTIQGYATNSVAQFTVGLMLTLACRLRFYSDYVSSGQYSNQDHFSHVGAGFMELAGKRVGIVGLGSIGVRVAEVVQALGASVVYFSTTGRNANPRFERVSLPTLLTTSDLVSIHAPRTAATANLIDLKALALMKQSAFLLNVGRGGIVNERDLVNALSGGMIAGAALDVFGSEPLEPSSPLLASPLPEGLILTPHCAWGGDGAQAELVRRAYDIIAEHLKERSGRAGEEVATRP